MLKLKTKTIKLEMAKHISCHYIKPKKGSVEYHQHLVRHTKNKAFNK